MATKTNFAPDTDTDQAVFAAGVFLERLMAVDCMRLRSMRVLKTLSGVLKSWDRS